MSVQSINNALTPQEIQQLLQQAQLGNADADGTNATTTDANSADGQNLPNGTNAQDAASSTTAPVTSGQSTLDPKTVLALLKIQEDQQMAQADTLIFGSNSSGSTGDPLLDALNAQSVGNADFSQSILDDLNSSASANSDISSASQQLLNFLNSAGGASVAPTTATSTDTAALAASDEAAAAAPAEEEA